MVHLNARLTFLARLDLVKQVEAGWAQAEVARHFRVSRPTVAKYVRRFRQEGETGLYDRSCRPLTSPRLTPARTAEAIYELRRTRGWGPHRISWHLKMSRSTVYAVLRRAGLNRLAWMHRTTREVIRYEHPRAGDMLHLDVKKLGRVPDGGGKRFAPGFDQTHTGPHSKRSMGIDYMHVALDDHSRYVYMEALPDERGDTTAAFLKRALDFYARRGVTVRRTLTDNAKNYTCRAFRQVAEAHGVRLKRTRPYRPQTNGKAERFNRILLAEWAYSRPFHSNTERLKELTRFLDYYNLRRPHGGIDGAVPASRL